MQQLKPKRSLGPDLVRITACFSVLSVHFFLNNGFYSEPVEGAAMFIMVLMRSAFMVCVPLFLLLTGYLMRNKKLEKGYYAKGAKTLVVYVLASAACIIYKLVHLKTGEPLKAILSVLNYTGAPYGWYIEMYIGLFLLIPFLNILYHGLPGRNAKRALLCTNKRGTQHPYELDHAGSHEGTEEHKRNDHKIILQTVLHYGHPLL